MTGKAKKCLIKIENALFRKTLSGKHTTEGYLFSKPIKYFKISSSSTEPTCWGVTGKRKSDFLKIIGSRYVSEPPNARTYPAISEEGDPNSIQLIELRDVSGIDKCHMAARYEAYSSKGPLDLSDDVNSVRNYVMGLNNYNQQKKTLREKLAQDLLSHFDLIHLQHKWINTLSNGQMRRARIVKAILTKPQLLVIDDLFLGLDPEAKVIVSRSLKSSALRLKFSVVGGFQRSEDIPNWISSHAIVDDEGLVSAKDNLLSQNRGYVTKEERGERRVREKRGSSLAEASEISFADFDQPFIEFKRASVLYNERPIFLDFSWKIKKGSRWRILGPNGCGKTTILSFITAEHPQSWKSVISIGGVLRRPGSGVTYFDTNNIIGLSSPELHSLVPPSMSLYQIITNGLIPNIGNSNFNYHFKESEIPTQAEFILKQFMPEIEAILHLAFSELSISLQKLALFLRAVIKDPEILLLDEAFSGMDENLAAHCHLFLEEHLKHTTVLAIGHLDREVPSHDYILKIEAGRSPTFYAIRDNLHQNVKN